MKGKFILGSAIVLSSICTAFALANSIQLKFNDARGDVLIWSKSNDGICSFNVVFLSETNPMTQGRLELKNGTNRMATCSVEGTLLSDNPKGWGSMEKFECYKAMTNRFRRSLNGAKVFEFEVATNLLEKSTFSVGDSSGGSAFSRWFYLKDFAKNHSITRNCELGD